MPHDSILSVKMFSSWIHHDQSAYDRQKRYFDALDTLPKVRRVMGVFQPRNVTCRSDCGRQYSIPEEKKTDVNLAVEIIHDAVKDLCEHIVVVSGDSDIQPAVEWIATNKPRIKLTVLVPLLPNEQDARRVDYYKTQNIAVDCQFLNLRGVPENQLSHYVLLGPGRKAVRPHIWSAQKLTEALPQQSAR